MRKYVVYTGDLTTADDGLLLWVFNPDFKFCSSKIYDGHPTRAMKVLFKHVEEPATLLDGIGPLEGLHLDLHAYQEIESVLEERNAALPESAKELQDWKASMIDRFDPPG